MGFHAMDKSKLLTAGEAVRVAKSGDRFAWHSWQCSGIERYIP